MLGFMKSNKRSKNDGNWSYSPTYHRKLEAFEQEKEMDTYQISKAHQRAFLPDKNLHDENSSVNKKFKEEKQFNQPWGRIIVGGSSTITNGFFAKKAES